MSEFELQVQLLGEASHINLRGNAADKAFLAAVKTATGCVLPLAPNTVSDGDARVCWLGPNEWLLVSPDGNATELLRALNAALQAQHVAVNDLSGGQLLLRLTGGAVRDMLAKACTLDLHQSVFDAGACAQTSLGKANVIILTHKTGSGVDVIVRRSFSDYLSQWLRRAGAEYGIEFA
jgi:sarcosine oxidase subunit gamma